MEALAQIQKFRVVAEWEKALRNSKILRGTLEKLKKDWNDEHVSKSNSIKLKILIENSD